MIEIIIPCYKEANRLPKTLDILETWGCNQKVFNKIKLTLANDGSTDETLKVMRNFKSNFFEINILDFAHKGYIDTLFKSYDMSSSKIICNMEADCSIHPKNFENFIKYIDDFDLVQGVRNLVETDHRKKSLFRKLLSNLNNFFFRMLFKCNLSDPQIGFKMFKITPLKNALKQIKLKHDGLKVSELSCRVFANNGKIKELFVDYIHDNDSRLVPKFSIKNPFPLIYTIVGCYFAMIDLFFILRKEKLKRNVTRF